MKKTNTTNIAGIEFIGRGPEAVQYSLRRHSIAKELKRYMENSQTRLERERVELHLGLAEYDQILNGLESAAKGYSKERRLNQREYVDMVNALVDQCGDLVERANQFNTEITTITKKVVKLYRKFHETGIDNAEIEEQFDNWDELVRELGRMYDRFDNIKISMAVADCKLAGMWVSVDAIQLLAAKNRCKRRLALDEEW